jgi:hypothetical protein
MASGLLRVTDRDLPRRPWPLRVADFRFRFGFRLATPNNSLTLASRRKTKHCCSHVAPPVARSRFHGHALSCLVIL